MGVHERPYFCHGRRVRPQSCRLAPACRVPHRKGEGWSAVWRTRSKRRSAPARLRNALATRRSMCGFDVRPCGARARLQATLPGTRPWRLLAAFAPIPVQRAPRRPVFVPAGTMPGAARGTRLTLSRARRGRLPPRRRNVSRRRPRWMGG
jgi:hypothetical protein